MTDNAAAADSAPVDANEVSTAAVPDDHHGPSPHPSAKAAAFALLGGFGLLMIANGMQGTLVGVRSELEGFGSLWVGAIMTAYFGGFLFGTQLVSVYLGRVGHIRTYAALASVASAAAVVHIVAVDPAAWFFLRALTGVCMAGIYVTVESWLNDIANAKAADGESIRGRLLASYMIVTTGCMALAQGVFQFADPLAIGLFVMASVLASLSLVPTALSTTSAPVVKFPEPMSIREMIDVVPTGVVTSFLSGMTAGALLGLSSVFATRVGLTGGRLALFMAAPLVGAMVGQWPFGSLSDRISRRTVMLVAAGAAAIAFGSMMLVEPSSMAAVGLLFAAGACLFPIYSLALAYVNDWITPAQMLGGSAQFVRINGVGAFFGPLVGTAAMTWVSPDALFGFLALLNVLIVLYIGYRMAIRNALPGDRQRPWVPMASRGGVVAASTLARPRRLPIGKIPKPKIPVPKRAKDT